MPSPIISGLQRATWCGAFLATLSVLPRSARAQDEPEPPTSAEAAAAKPDAGGDDGKLVVPPAESEPKKKPREVNAIPLVSTNAPPPLIWKWPTFSTADFVITGTGGAITLAAAIVSPRSKHSLGGPIGFDSSVRKALRVHSLGTRYTFRDASDVGLSLAVTWPFAADALTTAWWYRGSRETAEEMALIDLEALAITGAIQGATNVLVSRERPFGDECRDGELPSDAIDCSHTFHYRSFFSGHSAFSFTGAALICIHHMENDLLGSPWDEVSCATGYAVAATTATFRVVADVHYASDVLLGAAVGTLVGYGVPLLHYRKLGGANRLRESSSGGTQLRLSLVPSPGGLGVLGIF